MNKLKQLFQPKYRNRIENKIRELEIEMLKEKMQRVNYANPTIYVKSIMKQDVLTHDIKLLKELLK